MCRKSKTCILLGDDPACWNTLAPLPPPEWFDSQRILFSEAVQLTAAGNIFESTEILGRIRDEEMRDWFCIHGQNSGYFRSKKFPVSLHKLPPEQLDPRRSPARYERAVFERDHYTCRYCGLKIIAKEVMYAFEKIVGSDRFRTQGCNAVQYGCIHAFKPVADHVVPHHLGGRTDMDNLVTACPACNYGKYNYTLEQLGLSDPREYPPIESDWDGLFGILPEMQKRIK